MNYYIVNQLKVEKKDYNKTVKYFAQLNTYAYTNTKPLYIINTDCLKCNMHQYKIGKVNYWYKIYIYKRISLILFSIFS